jgi:hypothetical protein
MVNEDWLAVSVKLGAALTVITTGKDLTRPPPLATTSIVYFPGGVLVVGEKVKVLVPSPGALNEEGENAAVMPAGKLLKASEIELANAPACTDFTCIAAVAACVTETELLAVTAKLGGIATVNGTLSVWLYVPPLALMAKM